MDFISKSALFNTEEDDEIITDPNEEEMEEFGEKEMEEEDNIY